MTQYHGKNTAVLWSQFNLSTYFNEASVKQEASTAETTTFGSSSRSYVAGLVDGTLSLSGFFDDTATTGPDVVLANALANATNPIVTIGLSGATIAKRAKLAQIIETSYEITGNFDDAVTASVEMQVTGGVDNGIFLKTHAAETSSTNGAGQDNGAASSNGWCAHLHVTAITVPFPTRDAEVNRAIGWGRAYGRTAEEAEANALRFTDDPLEAYGCSLQGSCWLARIARWWAANVGG